MPSPFSQHVALLDELLTRRADITERIESTLLNVRGKETARIRNRAYFDRLLTRCVYEGGLPSDLVPLQGQLERQRLADGFDPVPLGRSSNELDPLDLVIRAYEYWEASRWPGKSGRLTFAQSVYDVFIVRQLELLALRMWDDGARADEGLRSLQHLLDRLNAPAGRRVVVRDARWLVQTAQGPITKHLAPYFRIATRVADSPFTSATRLGLHAAGAKLTGGHLRSQLAYRAEDHRLPEGDLEMLALSRNSNAMDSALLLWDLVPLLEGYGEACAHGDTDVRRELADAILQGLSPDPDLFLTRLDLLGPCTALEDLFVERVDEGAVRHTATGDAHHDRLDRYQRLIARLGPSLLEDAGALAATDVAYSPYGIAYGFAAEIFANMALEALLSPGAAAPLSFEDTFASAGDLERKRARAQAWTALPKRPGERDHFSHSGERARQCVARLMTALRARADAGARLNASVHPDARIYVAAGRPSPPGREDEDQIVPPGTACADAYCVTAESSSLTPTGDSSTADSALPADRREGRFVASAQRGGLWFGISKDVLTRFPGLGRNALLTNVPDEAIAVLRLVCPALVVVVKSEP